MLQLNCMTILILLLIIGKLANFVKLEVVTCQSNSLPAPFVNSNGQCECIRGYRWNGKNCLIEVQDDTTLDPVHLTTEATTQTPTQTTKVTTQITVQTQIKVTSETPVTSRVPTQFATLATTKVTTKATTQTPTLATITTEPQTQPIPTQTPTKATSEITTQTPTQTTTKVTTQTPTKTPTQVPFQTSPVTILTVATTVTTEPPTTQATTQAPTEPPSTTTELPVTKSSDPAINHILETIARAEKDLLTYNGVNRIKIQVEMDSIKNLLHQYMTSGGEALLIQIVLRENRLKRLLDTIES